MKRLILIPILNSFINIFAFLATTFYLIISIEPLKEMKDICYAFKKNWTITFWLLFAFIFFAVAYYNLITNPHLSYLFNTIGCILSCVFVNFITRESVNLSNEKNNVENLNRIYLRLSSLPVSKDVQEIKTLISDKLSTSEYQNSITEKIKDIQKTEDIKILDEYKSSLINNDYAATASTSGLTVSNLVIINTTQALK